VVSMITSINDNFIELRIFRDVILSVLGGSTNYYNKTVLEFAHLLIVLQLACHTPFIYYIGKEYLL